MYIYFPHRIDKPNPSYIALAWLPTPAPYSSPICAHSTFHIPHFSTKLAPLFSERNHLLDVCVCVFVLCCCCPFFDTGLLKTEEEKDKQFSQQQKKEEFPAWKFRKGFVVSECWYSWCSPFHLFGKLSNGKMRIQLRTKKHKKINLGVGSGEQHLYPSISHHFGSPYPSTFPTGLRTLLPLFTVHHIRIEFNFPAPCYD